MITENIGLGSTVPTGFNPGATYQEHQNNVTPVSANIRKIQAACNNAYNAAIAAHKTEAEAINAAAAAAIAMASSLGVTNYTQTDAQAAAHKAATTYANPSFFSKAWTWIKAHQTESIIGGIIAVGVLAFAIFPGFRRMLGFGKKQLSK